jgi:hypothetical protein
VRGGSAGVVVPPRSGPLAPAGLSAGGSSAAAGGLGAKKSSSSSGGNSRASAQQASDGLYSRYDSPLPAVW